MANILLVDDQEEWRISLAGLLADDGFYVETAATADEAVSALSRKIFRLVILDVRLDDTEENNTDGLKLMKLIKERFPQIYVIIITAYGTLDIVAEALRPMEKGESLAIDFISKDTIGQLPESVKRILGGNANTP